MTIRKTAGACLCLCKARISLFASLSAAMGFILAADAAAATGMGMGTGTGRFAALLVGTFLLAGGACALNQHQERVTDARMARTAGRPIPSGKISPGQALGLAVLLITAGEGLLLLTGNGTVPLLGAAAVLWYDILYTGLKKLSAFAAVPGALVGAIPPVMGWLAGGGSLTDPNLAVLVFFFLMWQVPHFWLHLLRYGQEYAQAGLPSLTDIFSARQLERLAFQWVAATAVSALLLAGSGLLRSPFAKAGLLAAALWLFAGGIFFMVRHEATSHARLFRSTNHFMLAVMALGFIDKFAWIAAPMLAAL